MTLGNTALEYSADEEIRWAVNDRVDVDASIMQGKPVIRGTRIPVELILRKLGEGANEQDLLDAYPNLAVADIRAALAYAANTLAHEQRV